MPPYILCSECEVVPVAKYGDRCEECEKRLREQDARMAAKLRRDTTKKTSLKNWMNHWSDR